MTIVFNLGGTIALAYDDVGPVTLTGVELLGESDAAMVDLDPVQSNALSWSHLIALRTHLLAAVGAGEREVVVMTGTDTAEDVGTFLHLVAPPGLRIALLCSLHTATRGEKAPGVGEALRWLRSETGGGSPLQLFVDGNPYGVPFEKRRTGNGWSFAASPDPLPAWRVPASSSLHHVMPTIPVIPIGIDCGAWVRAAIEVTPSVGFVLEAFGSGDVPPDVVCSVRRYLAHGGHVVIASLAHHGLIEPTYPGVAGTSHELLTAGCYGAATLTARQARMRLAVALSCEPEVSPREVFATFA